MNQHDQMQQMRDALQAYLDAGHGQHADPVLQLHARKLAEQALAAEPAPLVRLTDDDFEKVYLRFVGLEGFSPRFAQQFANAIMDAMIEKNKGKL